MADITRQGSAEWTGDLKHGQGTTSTGSGAVRDLPYSVISRFESGGGTNPEELIAAAHASCFSMMLAKVLGDRNAALPRIRTRATLTMRVESGGAAITRIHLATEVSAPGLQANALQQAAEAAKEQCPVSVLLRPGLEALTLETRLAG